MRRSTKIVIALAVATLMVTAAVAPLALLLLPNPVPVRITDPAQQFPGTYVASGGAFYHVVPYAESADQFPADSLVAEPNAHVVVRYKGLDDLASYGIYTFPDGRAVPVTKRVTSSSRLIELTPASTLKTGRYFVTVARDSIFGGTDYSYFSVAPTSASSGGSPKTE
jgi:hypothetical protein